MASGWGAYGTAPKANPFAEEQDVNFSNPNSGGAWDIPLRDTDQPAALPQSTAPKTNGPPAAAPPASGGSSWFGGKKGAMSKEAELAAKEEELKKREAEINALARKTKNWPFFKPVLYHDISSEVPAWNRGMVRFAYLGWLLGMAGFFVNWIVVMILMFSKTKMGVKDFFICTIATVIGLPMSFFFWYRSLYFAAQTDGSIWRYTKTFIYMMLQLAWAAIVIIAPPIVGNYNAGVLKMIDLFDAGGGKGYAFAIMCVINIGLWGLSCLIIFFTFGRSVKAMRAGSEPRLAAERRAAGTV